MWGQGRWISGVVKEIHYFKICVTEGSRSGRIRIEFWCIDFFLKDKMSKCPEWGMLLLPFHLLSSVPSQSSLNLFAHPTERCNRQMADQNFQILLSCTCYVTNIALKLSVGMQLLSWANSRPFRVRYGVKRDRQTGALETEMSLSLLRYFVKEVPGLLKTGWGGQGLTIGCVCAIFLPK